jgi:hypothetical protein
MEKDNEYFQKIVINDRWEIYIEKYIEIVRLFFVETICGLDFFL